MGRFVPKDAAVSYLTDSLTGVLKEDYDLGKNVVVNERIFRRYNIDIGTARWGELVVLLYQSGRGM